MYFNWSATKEFAQKMRDSEYRTITGALHSTKGFCAEGAICDISKLGKWHRVGTGLFIYHMPEFYDELSAYYGVMPPEVNSKFLGVDTEDERQRYTIALTQALRHALVQSYPEHADRMRYVNRATLTFLNDVIGLTIQEIGELILQAIDALENGEFVVQDV